MANKAIFKQLIPSEHGSWAFVIEPMLILQRGHQWKLAAAGLGVLLLFLAYRPLNLARVDFQKGKKYPRTHVALRFGLASVIAGSALFLLGVSAASDLGAWACLGLAGLAGLGFALLEGRHGSLMRELMGAWAPILIAGGLSGSLMMLGILGLRATGAVLSVRGFIGRHGDSRYSRWLAIVVAGAAAAWAWTAAAPLGAAYALVALHSLALGLRLGSPSARQIGLRELGISLCCVAAWQLV